MLMPCCHDVDIIRVYDPESYRIKAYLSFSHNYIIQHIGENQSINSCGYPQSETMEKHVDRI